MPTSDDLEALYALEVSLWQAETRYDVAHQENVFAANCFEFGRSGKRYSREDLIASAGHPFQAKLPLPFFHVRMLSIDVALLTYRSEVIFGPTTETANRSSIWVRHGASWQLHFHQGTPINDLD